jgi:hypothetical protein
LLSRPRWFTSKKNKKRRNYVKGSISPRRMASMHSMSIWCTPPMLFGMPTNTSLRAPSPRPPQEESEKIMTQE